MAPCLAWASNQKPRGLLLFSSETQTPEGFRLKREPGPRRHNAVSSRGLCQRRHLTLGCELAATPCESQAIHPGPPIDGRPTNAEKGTSPKARGSHTLTPWAGVWTSVTKGKLSLTPAVPGEDNVLDLSFDENDGSEFSLILFRFSKECI